ncbi:hypothetical protein SNEBB_009864 [Seison nebaliae]|nr:hypothetical protein SNEBB_009864 [Seison nebaliae]
MFTNFPNLVLCFISCYLIGHAYSDKADIHDPDIFREHLLTRVFDGQINLIDDPTGRINRESDTRHLRVRDIEPIPKDFRRLRDHIPNATVDVITKHVEDNKMIHVFMKKPKSLKVNSQCSSNLFNRDAYGHIDKIRDLGFGAQGNVILAKHGNYYLAIKSLTLLSHAAIQSDVLLAFNKNSVGEGFPKVEYHFFHNREPTPYAQGLKLKNTGLLFVDDLTPYCLGMSYIKGDLLTEHVVNYNDKINWRITVLLLRQLQILHFTFNEYEYLSNNLLLKRRSFTLFHGDLHHGNVIMTNQTTPYLYPQIIDGGLAPSMCIHYRRDVMIHFYNQYVQQEANIAENRHLVVPANMMFTLFQHRDMSSIFHLIYMLYHKRLLHMQIAELFLRFTMTPNILANVLRNAYAFLLPHSMLRHLPYSRIFNRHMGDVARIWLTLLVSLHGSKTYVQIWPKIVEAFTVQPLY